MRTVASDSGVSPPAAAGADEGGGEARSRSVMTRRSKNELVPTQAADYAVLRQLSLR